MPCCRATTRCEPGAPTTAGVHGAHTLGPRVLRRQVDPGDDVVSRTARYPGGEQSALPSQQQQHSCAAVAVRRL